jgi:predicted Zn-dependent protease
MEQLQQRCNSMLAKLIRTAGPSWSKQLAGTTITVRSTNQYAAATVEDRSIDIDITVFWDAPDETLAIAIGHELGHIALGHTGTASSPEQSRKDELNADAFAIRLGKALGYNKAGLFKFMHVKKGEYDYMNLIASQPNSSHPNFNQRANQAKKQGFQLSKGGVQQMNTLMTHLA